VIEFYSEEGPALGPAPSKAIPLPIPITKDPVDLDKEKEIAKLKRGLGLSSPGPLSDPGNPNESAQSFQNPITSHREALDEFTPDPAATKKHGLIKIIMGGVDGQTEIQLKDNVTYMGSSDQAAIKIKGFLVPHLAAAISRRPEGYFLKAVKPGYPKVNGVAIHEQVLLENGAMIEAGGTNMVFYATESKKDKEGSEDASNQA
jgi:hypothetical protein